MMVRYILPQYITLLSVGKPRLTAVGVARVLQYITLLSVGKPRRFCDA